MTDTSLHFQTINELARQIQSGEVSPVALTESFLERIEALNGPLTAFNLIAADRALAEAKASETLIRAGRYLGPLHGIPYGVKDIFDVAGLPTTAGSRTLGENIASADSTATRRLSEAGMIVLGKTVTVEFARGIVGINHIQGTPQNPWHEEHHVPGGSSAGSAVAVAAGLAPMALGSDTGGSVRAPAGLCGIVGLKTTVGRVSRHGVFPVSWTLDTVGPLTRTVTDAALVYQALLGEDPNDETTMSIPADRDLPSLEAGVKGLRLAIPEDLFFDDLDPEVARAVEEACKVFEVLGAHLSRINFPEAVLGEALGAIISGAEACVTHEDRLEDQVDAMDTIVGPRMLAEQNITATDYIKALRTMSELRRSSRETMRDIDLLLVPTTPIPAHPLSLVDVDRDTHDDYAQLYARNCRVGNLLNLCGLALPCGVTKKGLPIGLMIYGKPFAEDMVLRAGHAYEQATDWHKRIPDLSWID